jgi:5S rRNA maturation endonuclease (ribonuclease M5)
MDAREVIFTELSKVPGEKKVTGDAFMICCPFHGDTAPSCGVNLTTDTNIPLGFFHCFSGDTEVLTNLGTLPIEDLVGRKGVKVLTEGGVWVNTVFRNYGKQRLYEIVVTRNMQTKSIFATAEHEWIRKGIKKRTKTRDLPVGYRLKSSCPSHVYKNIHQLDFEGVRHGFVFGDGSIDHNFAYATLTGNKKRYMYPFFKEAINADTYSYERFYKRQDGSQSEETRTRCGKYPLYFKELPDINEDPSYILAFLAGLIAADGCVSTGGSVMFNNKSTEVLEQIRDLATKVGITTLSVTTQNRLGINDEYSDISRIYFARDHFPSKILLNPEHKRRFLSKPALPSRLAWKVVSVTKTDYIEDVYCCVVPGTHSFTLKDNILTGNCFGCSEKGGWNKLAAELGLQQLKGWELGFSGNGTKRANKKKQGNMLFQDADTALRDAIYTNEAIPWPDSVKWRGYEGTILSKLGALYYNDKMTKQMMTFFPIYMNGKYRGGVRAYLEKQVSGSTYMTTKGNWVSNYGLFGYEYIQRVVRKYEYDAVILVEGPRDALRLIGNNVPALAVLGAGLISERKMLKVMALTARLTTVYVMPDNDKAGSVLFSNVKHHMRGLAKVRQLKLPRPVNKDGKLIKLDPDNCDQDIIDEVRLMMREHRHA